MDFDPRDPLRPWPSRPPSQDEMNFLVRQEMSNLKALKRLSIGSSGIAAQDPDLPGLDVSESVVNGTAVDVEGDSPPGLARQASITKQRSIKRERSVVSIRRNRRERGSALGASDPNASSRDSASQDAPHDGFQANSPQAPPSSEDISNIWVPAGVHPELAPNEWQEFVTEKLAAIRNSHEAQQQSRLSRNSSRLSRVVVAPEEYVDAAIILDKRRKSSNVDKRRSILELSKDFERNSHNDPLQRAPSFTAASVFLDDADLGVQAPTEQEMDQPLVPLAFGAERGATSLRRSTHRLHKPALRSLSQKQNERPVPPPHTHQQRPEQQSPRESQHANHSHPHQNHSHPTHSHPTHSHLTHSHPTHSRHNYSHPNHSHPQHQHPQHQHQHQHQLQHQQEHQRLTLNRPPHSQGQSQTRSHSQSQVQQAQRGPGSIYGHSQQLIRDTPERAIRPKPADSSSDTDQVSPSTSKMKPPLSISVSAAKALAQTAEQPPSPSAATPSPTASVMLGYRRRKRADGELAARSHPDSPEEATSNDTQEPRRETSNQLPSKASHEFRKPQREPQSESPAVSSSAPHVIETSPEDIPERDPSRPVTRQQQEQTKRRSAEAIPQALKRRLGSEHKEGGDSKSDEIVKSDDIVKSDENLKSDEASKSDRRWRWLDSPKKERADPLKDSKENKETKESKDPKKTFANLFKKRDTKKDSKKEKQAHAKNSKRSSKDYKDHKADSKANSKSTPKSEPKEKAGSSMDSHKADAAGVSDSMRAVQPTTNSRQKGHARAYSRIANDALPHDEANNDDSEDPTEGLNVAKASTTEIQLPYEIPAHQVSDRSHVMMFHRFPLHIERAIYRLSHMKLANPRRPLRQQVLLSNFMYAYLNVVNKSFQEQQMAQLAEQQEKRQKRRGPHGSVAQPFDSLGDLEESQIEQLRRIETHSYEDGLYAGGGDEDDTSSSSDDEGDAQRHEAVSV